MEPVTFILSLAVPAIAAGLTHLVLRFRARGRRRSPKLAPVDLMAEWKAASDERRKYRRFMLDDWQEQFWELCRRNELSLYGSGPSPNKWKQQQRERERREHLERWARTQWADGGPADVRGEMRSYDGSIVRSNREAIAYELAQDAAREAWRASK